MSSGDGDKLVVPKFGSFKSKEPQEKSGRGRQEGWEVPKFGSFKSKEPQEKPGRGREEGRERRTHDHRRKRSRHNDEHERRRRDSRESKRQKEHHRSLHRETQPETGPTEDGPASRALQHEIFTIDTRGDPLLRRYGTLDRSQVPAYYRHGYGKVLGTSGRLVIHREGPSDSFSLRMPGEGIPRFRDRDGLRSKRPTAHSQPIRLRGRRVATVEEEEDEGFLSLKSSKKQKYKTDSSEDEQGPSYRSIEGKAKAKIQDSDFDSDSGSSYEVQDAESGNPLRWKSIQLNRRVKENPEDIDSWLELVDHQDELLRASTAESGNTLDNEARSYSEIKVSMLEKALQNATGTADRERILVPLMREGAKVWSNKVAAKKWAELNSQQGADSHALWRVRLDFAMTSITEFDFAAVKSMLLDRLQHVLSSPDAARGGVQAYLEAIQVFLLATRFIHDGGYRELAVAAWQAILELTFFRPETATSQGGASVPDSFQDFWESEVPRIGDAGACGWKQYCLTGGEGEPPEPVQVSPTAAPQLRDAYKAWSQLEVDYSDAARLPARTMDEGTEDDPFRVVIYADIEALLFLIPPSIVPGIAISLMDAFLIFCGLPPASSSEWARALYRDQLLAPLGSTMPSTNVDDLRPETNEDESIVRRPPLFSRPYSAFSISPMLLFSGKQFFNYLEPQVQSAAVDTAWLETVLSQLVNAAGLRELSEYYLAVSFARDPSSVKKTAKNLLKQSPDNAALYNAYALAEYARGNKDVAAKVLELALSSPLHCQRINRFSLHHTTAWMAFASGDIKSAQQAMCLAGADTEQPAAERRDVSFADVLKASSALSSSMSESLSLGHIESAETAAECLVLLRYLARSEPAEPMSLAQGNISAAMETLDSACQEMSLRGYGKSWSHERLVQSGAHLLYLHAIKGPHRRAYIREEVCKHLQTFPCNMILLSMLEWSDAGMRIVDETRRLLRDQTLLPKADCVGSRIFAIQHELGRGNVHTARAAFERAMRSDACKSSAMLWVWYIRFAHVHRKRLQGGGGGGGGGGKAAAVDVFYRALRHCPWAKAVLLEAFLTLAGELGSDELRSVYNMMTSKGLRVHVEMDEFMQNRSKADGRRG